MKFVITKMSLNNKVKIEIELDCGNCPLQKDEEITIYNKIWASLYNYNGIEIKNVDVKKC